MDYSLINSNEMPGEGLVLKRSRSMYSPGGVLTNTAQPGNSMLPEARARLRKLIEQQAELQATEPDVSGLQDFARKQGEAGEAAMMNALAAQFAGESFAPVQAKFLKRAAAAAEPMKFGGGILTPDGQFLKDPLAAREREVGRLDKLIGAERDDIMAAERSELERQAREERRREDARRDERDYQFRVDGRATQRAITDAARASTESNQAFQRATTLRGEYGKKADKIREGTRHAETVMTLLTDPTIARDPTKQVSLVFAFGKMLDPESVVRESEYALISNARGAFESLLQKPDQILTGARLTPSQLASMRQVAQQLYAGSSTRTNELNDYYAEMARRSRLNVDDVLPPGARRGSPAPAGKPAAGGQAVPPAPQGVDPAVWRAMTPEERALWK